MQEEKPTTVNSFNKETKMVYVLGLLIQNQAWWNMPGIPAAQEPAEAGGL